CRSIMARTCSPCAASARGSLRTCSALPIGASGLRSSWASIARNSSLRRSASRRASSARTRSVTSKATPPTRAAAPAGPGMGKVLHEAGAALLALAQRLFGPLAVGDVGGDANHARRAAGCVADHLRPRTDPMDAAVGPGDAEFGFVVGAAGDGLAHDFRHAAA